MSEDIEKRPIGRPPKYNTPEEMQVVIDDYFDGDAWMNNGEEKVYAPTVSGLAYALGMSRRALLDYEDKDDFLPTIKRAKDRIAIALEQRLYGQTVTGVIFNLKNNFGWKDRSETDHTSSDGSMTPSVIERRIIKPNDS